MANIFKIIMVVVSIGLFAMCGKKGKNASDGTNSIAISINLTNSGTPKNVKVNINTISYKKRMKVYISGILQLSDFFNPYSKYIGENSLLIDKSYDYLQDKLEANKDFVFIVATKTSYSNTTDFFKEFRLFSKTYSYWIMKSQLTEKDAEDIIKQLDEGLHNIDIMQKDTNTTKVQIATLNQKRNQIQLMKARINSYKAIEKNINPKILEQVKHKEPELTAIYARILM